MNRLTKYRYSCELCRKEFEAEDSLGNPAIVNVFCSDECREVYTERTYQKRLAVIPPKFKKIDCDKLGVVKQGIEQSLFITGATGVGKTVLVAGIVKEILKDEGRKVKWVSYPGFIMELQSLFKRDDDVTPFDRAKEAASFLGTLVIDDIGAEKITAFVQQITYYVINHREQEMLHTLITSNFSLQQIDEQIDTRISSRIAGMCKVIKLTGKDRRLSK